MGQPPPVPQEVKNITRIDKKWPFVYEVDMKIDWEQNEDTGEIEPHFTCDKEGFPEEVIGSIDAKRMKMFVHSDVEIPGLKQTDQNARLRKAVNGKADMDNMIATIGGAP